MDEDKKQKIMIGVVAGCLVLAGAFFYVQFKPGGGATPQTGPVMLKCYNESCGADYEVSRDEYNQMVREANEGKDPMAMMSGSSAVTCKECSEPSAFYAKKCEKCSAVFAYNYNSNDFPDRCPDCGVSAAEDKRNEKK